MICKMTISVKKEDVFQHICTTIPVEKWDEIKCKYHQTKKHKIDDFTPIIFNDNDLVTDENLGELISVILEGRKYKKIALMQFKDDEAFYEFWNRLNEEYKSLINFNTSII